jgi:hypothetical protein
MAKQFDRGRSAASGERRAANRRRRTERAEQRLTEIAEQQREIAEQVGPIDPIIRWSSGTWSRVPTPAPPPPPPPPPPAEPVQRLTMGEAAWLVVTQGYAEKAMAERVGCTEQQLMFYINVFVQRDA